MATVHAVPTPAAEARSLVPSVGIVIVTHNSADVLGECLGSIRAGSEGVELVDVVVVDNASTDASAEIAETSDLAVRVARLQQNRGYAAGFNAGVALLRERPVVPAAILLLNPDCTLRPGAAAALTAALAGEHRGIVAPRLVNPDGSLQPTLRRPPSVAGALVEAVLGGRVADRLGVGELMFAEGPHGRAGRVSWVTGAAVMMSWSLLEAVGPWDESFLLYSEETEFMLRAADHGWGTWYEPTALVEHRGGEANERPELAALLTLNKVRLFRRRHGRVESFAYRAAVLVGAAMRAARGSATSRAAAEALVRPSRRIRSLSELA